MLFVGKKGGGMNIYDLSLRHILVFNSVVETLSMSRSAQELFITQPAVSQTIKDIENKFSVKLFIRKSNKLHLTQEGKELYVYTKRIINLLEQAKVCLENFNALDKGYVKIGASTTIGNYLLPELITTFKEKYPHIDITVCIGNTKHIIYKLKLCCVEIGLIEGIVDIDDKDIRVRKFMKDEIVFICSPKNRLAKKSKVTIKDIEKEKFICREKGSGTRQVIERELAKTDVDIQSAYEFNTSEAIKNAVLSNLGISALSRLIVKKELDAGLLKEVKVEGVKITRWFHMLEIGNYNKAQEIFVEHITKSV